MSPHRIVEESMLDLFTVSDDEEDKRIICYQLGHIHCDRPKIGVESRYQAKVLKWNPSRKEITLDEINYMYPERDVQLFNSESVDQLTNEQSKWRINSQVAKWSQEELVIFEYAMFQFRKDFIQIQQKLPNKSLRECIEFYYIWKKQSPEAYMKLKKNRIAKRLSKNGIPLSTYLQKIISKPGSPTHS